ncbi:hypothetical protein [Actomonas aquatica]|uniref:Uncharacterized protein n=1 Tax=Actomonas aquatica TaxID=2866162 RepID=A0ABZ1C2A7_9BACT|nr:hypothetical protein [Opitutus sp. WL0086]WRQ85690.1 hypothetical protein K1X11_012830 [Opitutus sp. WL0086]
MKRFAPVVALLFLLSVIVLPLWGATEAETVVGSDHSPAGHVAAAITAVTGIAISPLLGTGAYGAYLWFQAGEAGRADLPWFAQMSFWLPALGLVGAVALKDAAGAALPPGWKKPFDVLETIENKATGLVAAGAVVPFTMSMLSKMIINGGDASAVAHTVDLGGVGMLHLAAIDWSWFLNIITVPAGLAIYLVVFMGSHAINGLILLSPWGAIDAALKAGRTALLGLLVFAGQMDPWIGAGLSLVVIVIAYFVAGWSFRLSVFSSIFCWDYFTGRKGRFRIAPDANKVFAGTGLGGAPQRTYGRLMKKETGSLEFVYRPWLVFPERRTPVPNPATLAVGRGAFFSNVTDARGEILVLPPRYRTHEEELAATYELSRGVQPIGINKAWSWLKAAMGFGTSASPA